MTQPRTSDCHGPIRGVPIDNSARPDAGQEGGEAVNIRPTQTHEDVDKGPKSAVLPRIFLQSRPSNRLSLVAGDPLLSRFDQRLTLIKQRRDSSDIVGWVCRSAGDPAATSA